VINNTEHDLPNKPKYYIYNGQELKRRRVDLLDFSQNTALSEKRDYTPSNIIRNDKRKGSVNSICKNKNFHGIRKISHTDLDNLLYKKPEQNPEKLRFDLKRGKSLQHQHKLEKSAILPEKNTENNEKNDLSSNMSMCICSKLMEITENDKKLDRTNTFSKKNHNFVDYMGYYHKMLEKLPEKSKKYKFSFLDYSQNSNTMK